MRRNHSNGHMNHQSTDEAREATGLGPRRARHADTSESKPRYDRPGHLADEHVARLLRMSHRSAPQDDFRMVFDAAQRDDLATELGEHAVHSMMGSGETWLDTVNAQFDEEDGGPFVETRSSREFANHTDDENDDFPREALPTSSASLPARPFSRQRTFASAGPSAPIGTRSGQQLGSATTPRVVARRKG